MNELNQDDIYTLIKIINNPPKGYSRWCSDDLAKTILSSIRINEERVYWALLKEEKKHPSYGAGIRLLARAVSKEDIFYVKEEQP